MTGGGSFNPSFFRSSVLNLTMKNYENHSTFAEVIVKTKVAEFFSDYTLYNYCYISSCADKLLLASTKTEMVI